MTSSIVNYFVEKYLASVLEIDSKQTNASILLGTLELHNLKIKPEIFQMVNLPYLELVNGYVGTIKVKMSMPRFYLYPINVSIDKVFLNVWQKDIDKLNVREEIEGMEKLKGAKLKAIEELYTQIDALKTESPKIAKQILSNLHVDIGDIVIRFEDGFSCPKIPFSIGVIMKRISIDTLGKESGTQNEPTLSELFQKQIQMKDFSIYMDCLNEKESLAYVNKIDSNFRGGIDQSLVKFLGEGADFYSFCLTELSAYTDSKLRHLYIMHMLNFDIKLTFNRNVRNGKPKVELEAVFPKVSLFISFKQVEALMKVMAYVKLIAYSKIGIAKNFYKKALSKEEKDLYLKQYSTYFINKYHQKKDKEPFPQLLVDFEKGLTYDQIQSMRAACLIKINYSTSVDDINKKLNKKGRLFSFGLSKEAQQELNHQKAQLLRTESQVNKQIQEKLSSEKSMEIDKYKDLPSDFLLFFFKFSMKELSVSLIEAQDEPLVVTMCSNLASEAKLFKIGKKVTVTLNEVLISQEIVKSELYPHVLSTEKGNDKGNLISIEFNENPLKPFNHSQYQLKMKTEKKLTLIVNAYLLQYLAMRSKKLIQSTIGFDQIQSYAKGEMSKYIQSGYLDRAISTESQFRKTIDLDISLFSPMIIIPQNIKSGRNRKCFIMSLGDLSVSSVLLPRPSESNAGDPYDRYIFTSKGIQMSTCNGYSAENKEGLSRNVMIKDYDVRYDIGILSDSQDKVRDSVAITVTIPAFDFSIDEEQLIYICSYIGLIKKENTALAAQFGLDKPKQREAGDSHLSLQIPTKDSTTSVSSAQSNQNEVIDQAQAASGTSIKFEFNVLKVSFSLMKLAPSKEIAKNHSRKAYLSFALNTFNLQLAARENSDLTVNMVVGNLFLYDYDHTLTENNSKEYSVNKNYQCLISSVVNSDSSPVQSLIDVKVNYSKAKDKTHISVLLNKLKLCINVISLKALIQFINFYKECFTVLSIDQNDEVEATEDQSFNTNYRDFLQLKNEGKDEEINPKFFSLVKHKMKSGTAGIGGKAVVAAGDKAKPSPQEKPKDNQHEEDKTLHKRKMTLAVDMKSIELNIPIEPTKDESYMLLFKFNFSLKQKTSAEIERISLSRTSRIKRENYLKRNTNIAILFYNVNIDFLLSKNGVSMINPINEHLLVNFRMALSLSSFIVLSSETLVNKLEISIEPLILHFGYREIKLVQKHKDTYRDALLSLKEKYQPSFQIDELTSQNESLEKLIKVNYFKALFESTIGRMKKKVQDEKYCNINSFNVHTDLNVKLDKAAIRLSDFFDSKRRTIAELSLTKLGVHQITNSDPVDSMNMGNALVEMISGREVPLSEFNIQNLFKYADVSCDIAMYYNNHLDEYEPFIEPLSFGVVASQVAKITRLRIDLIAQMVNLNFSSNSIRIFNSLMAKLNQSEDAFNKEAEELLSFSLKNTEEHLIKFANHTGADIDYWFDTNPTKKVLIHTGETQGYTKAQLIQLQGANAEMNRLQKDKFSFCVKDSKPIESRNYSFNHYENFCVQIGPEPASEALVALKIETVNATKRIVFDSAISLINNTVYDEMMISCGNEVLTFDKKERMMRVPLSWIIKDAKVFVQLNEKDSKHLLYESMSPFCGEFPSAAKEEKMKGKGEKEGNAKKGEEGGRGRRGDRSKKPNEEKEEKELVKLKGPKDKEELTQQKEPKAKSESKMCPVNDKDSTKQEGKQPKATGEFKKRPPKEKDSTKQEGEQPKESFGLTKVIQDLNIPIKVKLKLNDTKYSQKITLRDNDNQTDIFIAFDYIGLESINTHKSTSGSSPTIINPLPLQPTNIKPLSYVITINPVISFENNTPFKLTYSHVKGGNKVSHQLLPLEKYNDYRILPQDPQTLLQLFLEYDEATYKSFLISTMDLKGKITLMHMKNVLECNVSIKESKPSDGFNHKYFSVDSYKISSNTLVFYFDYIITNRLNKDIFITPIEKKKTGEVFTIKRKAISLLSTASSTMIMKSDSSTWSKPFNLNTHGIEGVVSLTRDDSIASTSSKQKNRNPLAKAEETSTDIAVIISSSKYLTHSILVILEPRYLLLNKLGLDVTYKQENSSIAHNLLNDQLAELKYTKDKRLYRLGIKGVYSGLLNVDIVESFDLKVQVYKEDLEHFKDQVFTYNDQDYFFLIRANVNSYDNGLINVMFTVPQYPFMEIENKTNEPLIIKETQYTFHQILPKKTVPFVWKNSEKISNELKCCIGKFEQFFSFSRFDKMIIEGVSPSNIKAKYQFTISSENNSNTRRLSVELIESKSPSYNAMQKVVLGQKIPMITKYNIRVKGIGVSVIDDKPRELFYVSFYGIDVKYANNILKSDDVVRNTMNVLFYLKNFQVDYALNDSFKNVIAPKVQILPCNEDILYSAQQEGVYPFIQFLICKQTIVNLSNDEKTEKYPQIDMTIQEFNVKVEHSAVMNLLQVAALFNNTVDFYKKAEAVPTIEDFHKEPIFKTELDAPLDLLMAENSNKAKRMLMMNYLLLSAVKINLTLRVELNHLDVSLIPNVLMRVIGTLGNTLARVTDSPLVFSEMLYENVYSDFNKMTYLLIQHYKKQAIRQVYKLLGSSDLIGNPIKLVENIGTGFVELFNEPRKGFLKGPSQFGQGLARGVNSLISGVVGGGFNAVGTISGTLLSATKNIKGQKAEADFEDEPENVIEGITEGVKGGLSEIKEGIAGVFLDPYKNAQTEGVKGVFKGIGTGFLGAILSPFSAVFKIVNSVSVGAKNVTSMQKKQNVRFRHPRVIIENEPIRVYDAQLAEAKETLAAIGDNHVQKIIFFANVKSCLEGFTKEFSTLILTDRKLQVVYNSGKVIFKIHVKKVAKCEVHLVDDTYMLSFEKVNKKKKIIALKDQHACCQIFDIFKYINQ